MAPRKGETQAEYYAYLKATGKMVLKGRTLESENLKPAPGYSLQEWKNLSKQERQKIKRRFKHHTGSDAIANYKLPPKPHADTMTKEEYERVRRNDREYREAFNPRYSAVR